MSRRQRAWLGIVLDWAILLYTLSQLLDRWSGRLAAHVSKTVIEKEPRRVLDECARESTKEEER